MVRNICPPTPLETQALPKACRLSDITTNNSLFIHLFDTLIDPHVHINSPGRDEWEGFDTAMRASAVGGTTTMLDMPINGMPATVDLPSHAKKVRSLMESSAVVNVGLIGGVVPQNVHDLSDLLNAGVLALKSFLVDTQSPDFHMVSTQDLRAAMSFLHSWQTTNPSHRRIPYIIHAEIDDNAPDSGLRAAMDHSFDHSNYSAYEVTRPGTWETAAVAEVISAVNGSQVHAHIAHVSSAEVTDQIRAARDGGLNSALITAETCPHYLLFAKEEIPYGATLFKCSPPIRSSANRARLLREVFSRDVSRRVIDIVASDHSPSASELKETEGNLTSAWGGIAGLQYRLQATLQAAQMAASEEKVSVVEISRLLSETPARLFGLDDVKGSISPGKDADIVIWDPNVDYTVLPEDCEHRVKHSAFDGRTLRGKVWYTLVRGHAVFYRSADGERHIHKGHGRYLKKDRMGQIQQEDIIKVV